MTQRRAAHYHSAQRQSAQRQSPQRRPRQTRRRPRQSTPARGCVVFFGVIVVGLLLVWAFVAILIALLGSRPAADYSTPHPEGDSGPQTPTLSYAGFDPGTIISDADFYNTAAMSRDDIASFISTWNAGCTPGDTPCLADWQAEADASFPEDDFCWAMNLPQGASAADLIHAAAQACEINPQVLLVVLQKEQGLITASGSGLAPYRYASAMGYSCPDGAECDANYAGLTKQVYYAARQFQMYRIIPHRYTFQAGASAPVSYHPSGQCGADTVAITNQATANLYNYTPYQPNAAALAGHGDECSAWGNLNFYAYWNAWFGGR